MHTLCSALALTALASALVAIAVRAHEPVAALVHSDLSARGDAGAASASGSLREHSSEPPANVIRQDDPLLGLKAARSSDGTIVYYTPNAKTPVVYLHGMCAHPMHMCPWLRDALPNSGLAMVCPTAIKTCGPGAAIWSGSPEARARAIDGAFVASGYAKTPAILVGFSQGGYLTADLVRLRTKRYRAAWIVGADPRLDARALREAGVERIVLSAGDFDGTAAGLRETARSLSAAGFPARYVGLGKVGHAFPLDAKPTPTAVLAWLDDGTDWISPNSAETPRSIVSELLVRQ